MKRWNKTVLAVLMQWDYGNKDRGVSCEKLWFYDAFEKLCSRVEVLWYDEYLKDLPRLQELLLEKAASCNPDLIFFSPFGDQFSFPTLDALKNSCPTVGWFGDDTWRFDSFSSRYATHFSHVATTDAWSLPKYRRLGASPILTEWASAEPLSGRIGPLDETESFLYDVSFVGGINHFREWFIKRLGKLGVEVACFGAGWPRGRVSFEEMEQIFRVSRINLNISNSVSHDIRYVLSGRRPFKEYRRSAKRAEQVKARNFEIPLAGGFQLSNYATGLERYLDIGREIALYTTPEDCAGQIGYYLDNEEERLEITRKSHLRAKNEHTYFHRLDALLKAIWLPGSGHVPFSAEPLVSACS